MPWEITFRRAAASGSAAEVPIAPLGSPDFVAQQVTEALPGLRVYTTAAGPGKVEAARAAGVEFPPGLRELVAGLPSARCGEYEGNDYSLLFLFGSSDPLTYLNVEVRGQGNALDALQQIADAAGWSAFDDVSGELLVAPDPDLLSP